MPRYILNENRVMTIYLSIGHLEMAAKVPLCLR